MNYDEWKLASPPESTEVTDCCRSGEYYEEYSEVEDCDVTICEEWQTHFMVVDKVTTPVNTVSKRATGVVENGVAGIKMA